MTWTPKEPDPRSNNYPGSPGEWDGWYLVQYMERCEELEKQLAHYRASIGGTALDWMGQFIRAPMWVRVLMAVTARRSKKLKEAAG